MNAKNLNWKFVQDWDGQYEDKLNDTYIIAIKVHPGWLIAFDDNDEPVYWYDLPDGENIFK